MTHYVRGALQRNLRGWVAHALGKRRIVAHTTSQPDSESHGPGGTPTS